MNSFGVAVSPCPNDTVIFAAWALGLVPSDGAARLFSPRFFWEDVQTLNEWATMPDGLPFARQTPLGVVKLSAAAALTLPASSGWTILDSGAAFGQGVGPKLALPMEGGARFDASERPRIAVPGLATTAAGLARLALGRAGRDFEFVSMPYDHVAQAVREGRADAGVLIHETALVVERYGLTLHPEFGDLGAWWANAFDGLPLPLGVIAARGEADFAAGAEAVIRQSLRAGRERRADIWPLVKAFARELDDATLDRHVAAYVTDMTESMGQRGREALAALAEGLTGAA